ncbi:conserved hypothetical protein [Desulfosarcina cetonica]|uniref:DUF4037 domain-containing protein n=1 Tax=Desulfosarcina cetonica TaxID=90730 RepID=UPI0006D10B4D|nr:DUF4037 domain-containing protein [Desulfosarcina cetonica]VTR65965.1 conserved hypothetical protein [Desulfosarcina cetonica]
MKGLTLSEAYYQTFGRPMLADGFAACQDRVAVGLVGLGSECFGFDDRLSQDHDWGPGFCLWLEKNDYERFGTSLQTAYDRLPERFMGFRRKKSDWGARRVGVMQINAFYASFIGSSKAPETLDNWLAIPEANLAACTNGKVFQDPLGAFTTIRQGLLDYYPEDIRLKKIAAKCMSAAQSGQYNYGRCIRRKSFYAAQHALVTFCEDVLALVFLLHRQYMPFYKWAGAAAKHLPAPGPAIAQAVDTLSRTVKPSTCQETMEEMVQCLIAALKAQELTDIDSPFLLDHGPRVHARIQHPGLKALDLWWGGVDSR